jgi:hypothetical protein
VNAGTAAKGHKPHLVLENQLVLNPEAKHAAADGCAKQDRQHAFPGLQW